MVEYLFGKEGDEHLAMNHILLELKKTIFYSDINVLRSCAFKELFFHRIRALVIKEKTISLSKNTFGNFEKKWKHYTSIYDFRGPDLQ